MRRVARGPVCSVPIVLTSCRLGYGLQDAERGVIFKEFPPVLHLQLKRFEFDYNLYTHRKINDRFGRHF